MNVAYDRVGGSKLKSNEPSERTVETLAKRCVTWGLKDNPNCPNTNFTTTQRHTTDAEGREIKQSVKEFATELLNALGGPKPVSQVVNTAAAAAVDEVFINMPEDELEELMQRRNKRRRVEMEQG